MLTVRRSTDVTDSPAGTVITTFDGVAYLVVPDDQPDADGQRGLMFLAAPHENYGGTFPVYAGPPEPDEQPVDFDVPKGTVGEVITWVGDDPGRAAAALEVDTRKTVIDHAQSVIAANDTGDEDDDGTA